MASQPNYTTSSNKTQCTADLLAEYYDIEAVISSFERLTSFLWVRCKAHAT